MIDQLLSIIDRLITLKEYRDRGRNRLFTELFEPVFNDLLLVHRDYIEMFDQANRLLPLPSKLDPPEHGSPEYAKQMRHAAEYLREKRIEFEPVRAKLRALTDEMRGMKIDADARDFVNAVERYFPHGLLNAHSSSSSWLLERIDYYSNARESTAPDDVFASLDSKDLHWYVEMLIDGHRRSWSDVCETYAALKVAAALRA